MVYQITIASCCHRCSLLTEWTGIHRKQNRCQSWPTSK